MPNSGGNMSQRRSICLKPGANRGFTLIELMVVVAVIGVIALVAIPGMQMLTNASRLNGAASELTAALQLARSEAVRRNARVTVCSTTTCAGGSTSWAQVFVRQPNGTADDPAIIRSFAPSGALQISGPAAGIVFRPSGLIESAQQVEIGISGNTRYLCVQISGLVSVKKVACS